MKTDGRLKDKVAIITGAASGIGKPEEVAHVILFLAGDEASYLTEQALPVDGGNTVSLNLPDMKV